LLEKNKFPYLSVSFQDMRTKVLLLLLVSGFFYGASLAQQEPQFQQNMFNQMTINPGYAGTKGSICTNALYRNQWVGFVGSPSTFLINVDAPVKILKGGLGLTVISDELGLQSTLYTRLSYSFHKNLGPGQLGIGIRGGFINSQINGEDFVPFDNQADPTIPIEQLSGGAVTFGFGLYYSTPTYYVGLSSTQLSESAAGFDQIDFKLKRHFYATGGFTQRLTAELELKPSLYAKLGPAVAPQIDLSALLFYNNQFWAGVGYRAFDVDAIPIYVGVLWNNLKIGYSYDISLNALRGFNSGSHEVFVGYCFKLNEKVTAQRYRNVRFL